MLLIIYRKYYCINIHNFSIWDINYFIIFNKLGNANILIIFSIYSLLSIQPDNSLVVFFYICCY
jgi:hypothetical protein